MRLGAFTSLLSTKALKEPPAELPPPSARGRCSPCKAIGRRGRGVPQRESPCLTTSLTTSLTTPLSRKTSGLESTLKDISRNSWSAAVTSVRSDREQGVDMTIHLHSQDRWGMLKTTLESENCCHAVKVVVGLKLNVIGLTWISPLSWALH